jgi:hypothetical protein
MDVDNVGFNQCVIFSLKSIVFCSQSKNTTDYFAESKIQRISF